MATVTFTSPKLNQDITVHATAGDQSTLLAVAREHVIPLDCDCEDGESCSCAVQVSTSKASDAPWRLACQYIVRDDDLLVKF